MELSRCIAKTSHWGLGAGLVGIVGTVHTSLRRCHKSYHARTCASTAMNHDCLRPDADPGDFREGGWR
ncbi:hypothetical protein VTK56DRAFT_4190 [Thermocarpiscus australiensis]